MSPVVLEDGVIHRPTRLSVGPAWLTTAVYLNVSGSKLARGRAVRKGAGGGVSLGTSQRPVHTPPQPWRGGCKQGGGAVHGSEPHWPLSFSLGTVRAEVGEYLELSATLDSDGSWGPLQW